MKAHLAPFVPGHSVVQIEGMLTRQGAVSAAPFGSASILPISWMYIRMMGAEGLKQASQVAILNANYIATRLKSAFPVLYTGRDGRVAHECILDIRPLKEQTGISELDIAKRLIDYGFHAPTMSFPVAGHADGGADRVRKQSRAGPLYRRDAGHPHGDRPRAGRRMDAGR